MSRSVVLHAADLHLDAPFEGIGRTPPHVAAALRGRRTDRDRARRDGHRKQAASQLSRGTTEQLYLSLRLGLAQELARRGVALPLVMDDVLVHFDPERARGMAAVLSAFAQEHQVLFFTCHPATRDLLLEHGHAARVVEL